ncbi:MAG: complex I NDUFA9 subunit family protein [Pseudomonadota bacterium]|nr:complex I NDUFA9 subunit family protein [Pseudomonadota bacterium]
MNNRRVCILGGGGFVGHHLAAGLTDAGYLCRVLTRHPQRHRDLQVLPGLELRQADIFDAATLAGQLRDCFAVVNLVGILNETRGQSFQRLHVDLVDRIIDGAREAGVERYLHMSALHADAAAGTSLYLRTKGEGEDRAHGQTAMGVTSFRPSVIFGPGDSFFNRFATLLKLTPGVFPLACPHSRFAPVFVGNVAGAMIASLGDESSLGRRFDLCGPRIFTLRELVEYTAETIGRKTLVLGLNDFASRLQARVFQLLPGRPFTMDNYLSMQTHSICDQNALSGLGIRPTDIGAVVPGYLR